MTYWPITVYNKMSNKVYDIFMHVFIVVIKLLVFLVTDGGSGYITRVDELEVILQDVFGGELLHTKSAIS